MRSTSLSAPLLFAASALAAPLEPRQSNIDTTVLQFALTLEHLENVFYKGALQNFTQQDFEKAGYGATYYQNLKYIASDEQSHVEFLQGALSAAGVTPNQACSYQFPYKDVKSFITLSSVLEGVGTSAYLGGAPLITNKQYLTAAGSILVTEAKHTSYQRANIGEVPYGNAYGTPLDPTSVFTLAAMFISSCPPSNMALPFTPFPALTYDGPVATDELPAGASSGRDDKHLLSLDIGKRDGRYHGWHGKGWGWNWQDKSNGDISNGIVPPSAGETVSFTAMKAIPQGSYLTFVSGLDVISVKGDVKGKTISAAIPQMIEGQTYVFASKTKQTMVQDSNIIAGPAILEVKPAPPQIDYSEQ